MADKQGQERIHTDHHGNSPAAWTAVGIILIASVIAGLSVVMGAWVLFFISAIGLPLVAVIIGKIMSSQGLGSTPARRHSPAEAEERAAAGAREQGVKTS
jgi:hypothetical protein